MYSNVLLKIFNDITCKSCEQRFVTKEHRTMDTNLILWLYISVLQFVINF